jgi:hypothetical protein
MAFCLDGHMESWVRYLPDVSAPCRDVKPDNFLFLNSNEHSGLRAIDFGLAEYCEPGQYLTDRVGIAIVY